MYFPRRKKKLVALGFKGLYSIASSLGHSVQICLPIYMRKLGDAQYTIHRWIALFSSVLHTHRAEHRMYFLSMHLKL